MTLYYLYQYLFLSASKHVLFHKDLLILEINIQQFIVYNEGLYIKKTTSSILGMKRVQ